MIPKLTLDIDSINSQWKEQEGVDFVKKLCKPITLKDGTEAYRCDNNWVDMKVFNEFKEISNLSEFFEYGYCDTEDSLVKYLQKFKDDKENNYFVEINTMSMDYEKYYKNGSYINKDGVDTEEDYYYYIDEHPEMEVPQDVEGEWITFAIYKLEK